jgi:tRNA pseudouridine55 synthase
MIGFLNINKPAGLTSHDVVARVRRVVGRSTRAGHAGSLDPAATGVLPVALGAATRLIEYLVDTHKGYRAQVQLGATTTTDDAEGETLHEHPVPNLDASAIEAVLTPFRGTIMQRPPLYSAIHHQGQRLYHLARSGHASDINIPLREVTIDRLELESYNPHSHSLSIHVVCSKGTYIRSLARDIGEALGCGAHLAALQRSFVGTFTIEHATPLSVVQKSPEMLSDIILPPEVVISHWPMVIPEPHQRQHLRHGRAIHLAGVAGERARAHEADGRLLAVLYRQGTLWHPEKVLL